MTPRVLVTGAGGFVCRHIVTALLDTGFAVTAVDRAFDPDLRHQWANRVEVIESDASDLPDTPVDYVIHGAAITADPNQAGQTPEENFRANLNPLLDVLEWANRQRVQRAILISSVAVFRETPSGPIDETMQQTPRGLYAVAKQTMESLAETLVDVYGRDLAAVRFSNIYGPGELPRPSRPRITLIGAMINEALTNNCITVPAYETARDWTFAPDLGRAIVRLVQTPKLAHHVYHLAAEQLLTPLEIAQTIQVHLPDVRLEIVEQTPADKPLYVRRGYLSSERLRRETGFDDWTSLTEGICQTIAWQRDHTELAP